jgi:site-specific recombinase XerD
LIGNLRLPDPATTTGEVMNETQTATAAVTVRDPFLLATDAGRGLGRRNVGQQLTGDARRVGLQPDGAQPVGPHDLRHSAAALAFESGASVVEVCELMRHANAGVTL